MGIRRISMYATICKITLLAISLVMSVMIVSVSGQQLEKPLNATIDFSEHNFDFGCMPKGAKVTHTYNIENKGTDTLRIIKVTPSCGCTYAPLSKSDVGPGDSSQLDIFFDSKKFHGKITKKVSVLSNDPTDPFTEIYFSALVDRVHPLLSATPAVVESSLEEREKIGSSYQVKLSNTGDAPIGVDIVSSSEPYLEAKLSRASIEPGQSIDLIIKLRSTRESQKDAWYSVTLETNDPQKQRLTIPLFLPAS